MLSGAGVQFGGGYDWDFYDGAKPGVVTAYNALYYRSLQDVAYIEASLGNTAKATAYNRTADQVRDAINANLLNPSTGTYYLSESDHSTLAQDANALAVLFGIAPAADVPRILNSLKSLWGPSEITVTAIIGQTPDRRSPGC